ncbi:zinc finger CCHC domain-containing protein 17 isoform X3 [Equus quagga]|uniref:zinc finger CCHC domain-containing protein 17 isoform X3 n=1 Tax=Equus quagga TaxID=89248 RepID=UPI001EE2DEC7|nr:zinc finger CCHC domain-containing protein 17 isoform X3 [Equus quagga]
MNSGRPETMENLPALYTIFQGEVAMVTDYGAFIKIPGCRKQGLVHRTHMSSCRVDKPSEIVDVGDKVWVKLIGREMKNDRIKVSLSMKVVNQGTGKDLDPNNVIIEQEERRRRSFQDYTGQKITLEAVLNTTCKKCGCKGHFAKDCFMQPGGTKYSLIPDKEEAEEEAESAELEKPDPTRNSSRKRKKKVRICAEQWLREPVSLGSVSCRLLTAEQFVKQTLLWKRRKRNIETGNHLILTAQTLRVIQARRQDTHQKTARQQRRRKRRRSIRRSTRRSYYPLQLPLPKPDSCTGVQAGATGSAVEK